MFNRFIYRMSFSHEKKVFSLKALVNIALSSDCWTVGRETGLVGVEYHPLPQSDGQRHVPPPPPPSPPGLWSFNNVLVL